MKIIPADDKYKLQKKMYLFKFFLVKGLENKALRLHFPRWSPNTYI